MSEDNKQVTPAATPALTGGLNASLEALVQIMFEDRARQIAKEQAVEAALAQKQAQRKKNADSHYADASLGQTRCRHLKGGRGPKRRGFGKDFAVYIHTYPNAEQVIRCFLCGMKWKRRDTDEFLYRGDGNGKLVQVKNHTGIGWAKAVEMLADTTNTPSASEIPIQATPTISSEGV